MSHSHSQRPAGRRATPWLWIVAVVLMLLAIVGYVMTDDESLVPGEAVQPRVPAAP